MASKLQGTDTLGGRWEADETGRDFPLKDVDLVIMNPPFTANDKRGQKFTGEAKKAMQRHELRVRNEVERRDPRAGGVATTNSIRTFFTPLADQLLQDERGVIAKVLPATACIGASGESERRFLAERFRIERIVTSHDPKRINFSENTGIHESLLICRRRDGKTETAPTEFVSLRRMPATAEEALDAGDAIAAGRDDWGRRTHWPAERIRTGDWTPVQWYDGSLAEAAWELEANDGLEPLGQNHTIGPTRQAAQDSWRRYVGPADTRPLRAVRIFDSVAADLRRTIAARPDQWVSPGGRRRHLWKNVSRQAARLLVTERFGTTSARLTALFSSEPTFGFSWMPVSPTSQATFHGEALSVWLNSTAVRLMLLNRRAKKLTYPRWSVAHWQEIRIPKPHNPAWSALAAAWDEVCGLELLPMRQADECPARKIIDRAASRALNVDEARTGQWRRKLASEPTVSNNAAPKLDSTGEWHR